MIENERKGRYYHYTCLGEPVGAVRQNKSDRWKKRKCVLKYRAYCDRLRESLHISDKMESSGVIMVFVSFYLPIPKSTRPKLASELVDTMHSVRPDIDNLLKAVLDAIFSNDSKIPTVLARKFYSDRPRTEIVLYFDGNENISHSLFIAGNERVVLDAFES